MQFYIIIDLLRYYSLRQYYLSLSFTIEFCIKSNIFRFEKKLPANILVC